MNVHLQMSDQMFYNVVKDILMHKNFSLHINHDIFIYKKSTTQNLVGQFSPLKPFGNRYNQIHKT
jgi:predicted transcriptional regulator